MANSLPETLTIGAARSARAALAGPRALRLLGVNAVGCALLAVLLWALVPAVSYSGFWPVFVHSELIGLIVCLMLIVMRSLLGATGRTRGAIFYGMIPVLALIGYYAGTALAHWVLGGPPTQVPIDHDTTQTAALITTGIATIVGTFFFMTRERISDLELAAAEEARQAQQAQREVSEAQLSMLRAQVEPHMLFNTLANLRELVLVDPPQAQAMLDRLIDFLRATLDGSRATTTTLRTEFAMLEDYLALMQMRLATRLRYRLELPPALADRTIPSLLLQPLVENAIVHGIEPSLDGGTIDVVARVDGPAVEVTVGDTGVGIDGGQPRRRPGSGGFGIEQLRQRLANAYGDRARIDIESPPRGRPCGTLVRIRIED